MKSLLLGTSAAVALHASALAAGASPVISYVPNSLVESVINHGPWTLHESGVPGHDASGIGPPVPGPALCGIWLAL